MPDDAMPMTARPVEGAAHERDAGPPANSLFHDLLRSRSRFVLWASVALLTFNLLQPILSVFTSWLDQPAFGELSVGWAYAFAQFVVPLALLHLYAGRARTYDAASAIIRRRLVREGR